MTEIWVSLVGSEDEPFPVVVRADARIANLKRAVLAEAPDVEGFKAKELVLSDGADASGTLSATALVSSLTAGSPENPVLVGSGAEPSFGSLSPLGDARKPKYPDNAEHFGWVVAVLEVVVLIMYATCVEYDAATKAGTDTDGSMGLSYPFFQDVHVMIYVGFGFLMTFLKCHTFGSAGYNFVIAAFATQVVILTDGFFHHLQARELNEDIKIGIDTLITGDFGAAVVLITFGGLLGKVNLTQMMVLTVIECIAYSANFMIGALELEAVDMGGSMFVHAFGAFFGLAAAWMVGPKNANSCEKNASNKTSDTFAMVGTLFLWIFWPSFTGALASGSAQQRVVVNTLLALTGSCVSAFASSALMRPGYKLDMVDIQNATLAGGVAIGTACDLMVRPWGAIAVGVGAGILSVWTYEKFLPWLEEKIGLYDTCGILALHGLPGVFGGLIGVIAIGGVDDDTYHAYKDSVLLNNGDAGDQAQAQILALLITLAIAIASGILGGAIIRHHNFRPPRELFDDSLYFAGVDPSHMEAVHPAYLKSAPGQNPNALTAAEEAAADLEAPVKMDDVAKEIELKSA